MQNIDRIADYIKAGCNQGNRIGLELEHFVCNENYEVISYYEVSACLKEICDSLNGTPVSEKGNVFGGIFEDFTLSLEPGCQLEISISPKENTEEIKQIYLRFREACDKVLAPRGYCLLEKGVFPLVENGDVSANALPLIPKERYRLMDAYFQSTGELGRYMMRATASTQVSIDFSSEKDAMKKMRVLEKLAPVFSLLTENKNGLGTGKKWKQHLIRTQIWRDVDPARCGYFKGTLSPHYTFRDYAAYVYTNPCILLQDGERIVNLQNKTAADYYNDKELNLMEHILSMYFPTVRLKRYIEFRVADSMPIDYALGFAILVKTIVYNEELLDQMDCALSFVDTVEKICEAEDAVFTSGYKAEVYGKPIVEWIALIAELALNRASEEEKKYIHKIVPLPVINDAYQKIVLGQEQEHKESAYAIRNYLLESTAKYHNRVVRTMYLPKIFKQKETEIFGGLIQELYGIFDKVIREFEHNPDYRALFGFPKELVDLILRDKKYSCNIPISRIDIFYNEETGDFKFCEFNTDGTSAMNEDRELNIALERSAAYKTFCRKHPVQTFELFDSWVDEAIQLYREWAGSRDVLPNVVIVDFMEKATVNEFLIFKERFERKGCKAEVCDIRNLVWDGKACYTETGMKVDLIYRRAVTSDILAHMSEVQDFISAVKNECVCLLGDFRTQIVHNKILFKILHMKETLDLLTGKERAYVKAHVPLTISLDDMFQPEKKDIMDDVFENKDHWIIKPEDSYGSKGVYAGVEISNPAEWVTILESKKGERYILQAFNNPFRLDNIDLLAEEPVWVDTSNLTGLFVYNQKFSGIYSRISLDKMISTQYNEMSLPTIIVE